jgi:hypothetical protein
MQSLPQGSDTDQQLDHMRSDWDQVRTTWFEARKSSVK